MANPVYTESTYTLAPGEEILLADVGDFVAVLEATADFEISINGGPKTNFRAGLTYNSPSEFQRISIQNTSIAQNIVTLAIGKGGIRDSRLTLAAGIVTKPSPSQFADRGAVSALAAASTLLIAANAARASAIICNDGAASVYVRGGAAAAAGGALLGAGAVMFLDTTDAIYAYNSGAAAVSILVSELVVV